jgi:thiamine-monophosphate kinase
MLFFNLRDEWSVTERLRRLAKIPPGSPLRRGIGDDCAIFRPRGSIDDLLFTCDLFAEGVHFSREFMPPSQAGRRALARSLSDIAAMGGRPQFCLVALCAAEWTDTAWINRFYSGLLKLAGETGTVLAGGDLSHGRQFICDVTVCGSVPRGKALLRSGARPGDEIYVSGRLGRKNYTRLDPRLALGVFLREKLPATSAMDLSDGLSLDLRRLCLASGVAAEITNPPITRGVSLEQALHGGEDYELLFTVRPGARVPAAFEGLPLSRIGRMVTGTPGQVLLDGLVLKQRGYDHFEQSMP